jgi:hypothetical protein
MSSDDGMSTLRGSSIFVRMPKGNAKYPKANFGLLITYLNTTRGCFDVVPVEYTEDEDGNITLVRSAENHPTFKGAVHVHSWATGTTMLATDNISEVELKEGDPALVTFIPPKVE